MPLPKIWEQMNLAWHHGATNLWIANVGDIKPEEVPLEFFLTFAWNPEAWSKDSLDEYLRLWATREFGPKFAREIADHHDGTLSFETEEGVGTAFHLDLPALEAP